MDLTYNRRDMDVSTSKSSAADRTLPMGRRAADNIRPSGLEVIDGAIRYRESAGHDLRGLAGDFVELVVVAKRNLLLVVPVVHRVSARAAGHHVGAEPALDLVIARAGADRVIPAVPADVVVALAAVDQVVARAAVDAIVAGLAEELRVGTVVGDDVVSAAAVDRVTAASAEERLIAVRAADGRSNAGIVARAGIEPARGL